LSLSDCWGWSQASHQTSAIFSVTLPRLLITLTSFWCVGLVGFFSVLRRGSLNLSLEVIQAFKQHLLNLILIRIVEDNFLSFRSQCLEMSEEQLIQLTIPITSEIVPIRHHGMYRRSWSSSVIFI
jgi:hypothetical protein